MKKLIVILFVLIGFCATAQNIDTYKVRGRDEVQSDGDFIMGANADTLRSTTQISTRDTSIVTSDYLSQLFDTQYSLVEGGTVSHDSLFVVNVQAATYFIGGELYNSPLTSLTLTGSDPVLSRIDVIVVDINGNAVVVEGVPSLTPIRPYINLTQQLQLTYLSIPAGSIEPEDLFEEPIYKEGEIGEWDVSVSADLDYWNKQSTNPVYRGNYALRLDSLQSSDTVFFESTSGVNNVSDFETVSLYIKTQAKEPGTTVWVFLDFTLDGETVSTIQSLWSYILYSDTANWHLFSYKLTDFIWSESTFDGMKIRFSVGKIFDPAEYIYAGVSFDNIKLQRGIPPPPLVDLSNYWAKDQITHEDTASWHDKVPYEHATRNVDLDTFGIRASFFQADTTYIPTGNELKGTSYWNKDEETYDDVLGNGVIGQRYLESFTNGQNDTGGTLANGTVATYVGSIGNSGNFRINHTVASAAEHPLSTIGIITADILDGEVGKITTRGKTRDFQTDGANYGETWIEGTPVYKSSTIAGGLTNVPPQAPTPAIPLAVVISAHPTNGVLFVRPQFPQSIVGLIDVNGTSLDSTGQFLVWNNDSNYFDFDFNINDYFRKEDTLSASQVSIALGVGEPTVDQLQLLLDNIGSSGFFLGGELSDGGSGTLDVAAGSGFIRTTNDNNAELQSFTWNASLGVAVPDNTTQYVYVDDSGVISLSTDEFLEAPDKILIGVVTDELAAIESTFNLGVRLDESIGQAGRFIRRVHSVTRDKRKGGLIFGQSGDANRDITISTGVIWWGRTEYPISSFNTSGADVFTTYSAGGQESTTASQWPSEQYDNSGTLTTMTNNRWANLFFYIEPDDNIVMVYGRDQFVSEAQAEEEGVPSTSLPTRISETSLLAARFTFKKSATTATISSAFEQLFANAGVTDHGDLSGLLDDDHPQYHNDARADIWFVDKSITDLSGNNWKVFYSNGTGAVTELALGADGTFLKSNGAAVAPTFASPSGTGDMLASVYDPTNVASDAFDMDNMVEGISNKILTATERTILSNTTNINSGNNAANTLYANDYRAANFIADIDYEVPLTFSTGLLRTGNIITNTVGFQDLSNTASTTNRTIFITDGTNTTFSVIDNDNDPNNEIQDLSGLTEKQVGIGWEAGIIANEVGFNSTSTEAPIGGTVHFGVLTTFSGNSGYGGAFVMRNDRAFFQTREASVLQGWSEFYHTGNFTDNSTNWNTAYTNRITSLTTTGNSGVSTLISNTLNIPNYTLSGLGGQSQLNGTGFVKAVGTVISYDNSTYEIAFSKNTGFNKNYGSANGTVLEGRTFGTAANNNTGDFEPTISAGTTLQYWRGDKTFQTLNTSIVPELTNLYYTEGRVNANTNVAANTSARHTAVTIGTANGLTLSTQQLSLGLSSTSTIGALSATDWDIFNGKLDLADISGLVPYTGADDDLDMGSKAISNTGAVTIGGNATFPVIMGTYNRFYGTSNLGIYQNTVANGAIIIAGGNTTGNGANISLNGGSHTSPNLFKIRQGTTTVFEIVNGGATTLSSSVTAASLHSTGGATVADAPVLPNAVVRLVELTGGTEDADFNSISVSGVDIDEIYAPIHPPGRLTNGDVTLTASDHTVILNTGAPTKIIFPASLANDKVYVLVNRWPSSVTFRNSTDTADVSVNTAGGFTTSIPASSYMTIQFVDGVLNQIQ